MHSIKSIFIAILLAICLQVISSQARYVRTIPGPWIVTDIAGRQKSVGEKVYLTILSPGPTTITVNILQRGSSFNQTLTTSTLKRGKNKVSVIIPSGVFATPSPQNYFAIYQDGQRVDYSGTFQIGNPGWGITVYKPVAGDILKIGCLFKPKWKGSFVPPGQDASKFVLARGLLEPANIIPGTDVVTFNFINGQNLTFSDGTLTFKLPSTIPTNTLYKFGFLAVSNTTQYPSQIYSAGTFLIVK